MATCKFNIGDTVRRIKCDNHFSDGRTLKVGTICKVVDFDHEGDVIVKVGNEIYNGNINEYFELVTEKIVITHDGKTTTATKYCADGSKVTATAACSPEDTFDFNVGAKLAMDRLMKKVAPVEEWKVVNRSAKVGDYIRLKTNGMYPWNEPGDILKVDVVKSNSLVSVYGRNHSRPTDDANHLWNYLSNEYEVVEKVKQVSEPKAEAPKYYNGKVICIKNKLNDNDFTVGKVYNIVNGQFTDNNGNTRPVHTSRVKNENDLNVGYFKTWHYQFIPLVEDEK